MTERGGPPTGPPTGPEAGPAAGPAAGSAPRTEQARAPAADRLDRCLRLAAARRERLLVVYLTLGDPLTDSTGPGDLALAAVEAGADILELGLPTPSTNPRGVQMRRSFDRARGAGPGELWRQVRRLREAAPATPLVPLVFPQTVADLGWDRLVADSAEAGADGLVLTAPDRPDDVDRVASAGLSAIPLIDSAADGAAVHRLEAPASHLTYRNLAGRTGDPLDLDSARRLTARLAATARKPFLAGFGIRSEHEIRTLAPHAAGLVVGSELLRLLAATDPRRRPATTQAMVRRWKAATVLEPHSQLDGAVQCVLT
jgi:tryptophan synthase alpha chain